MKHRYTFLLVMILYLVFGGTVFARPHMTPAADTDDALACQDLAMLELPDTTSIETELVTTGTFDPPGFFPPITGLPVFCRLKTSLSDRSTK